MLTKCKETTWGKCRIDDSLMWFICLNPLFPEPFSWATPLECGGREELQVSDQPTKNDSDPISTPGPWQSPPWVDHFTSHVIPTCPNRRGRGNSELGKGRGNMVKHFQKLMVKKKLSFMNEKTNGWVGRGVTRSDLSARHKMHGNCWYLH